MPDTCVRHRSMAVSHGYAVAATQTTQHPVRPIPASRPSGRPPWSIILWPAGDEPPSATTGPRRRGGPQDTSRGEPHDSRLTWHGGTAAPLKTDNRYPYDHEPPVQAPAAIDGHGPQRRALWPPGHALRAGEKNRLAETGKDTSRTRAGPSTAR